MKKILFLILFGISFSSCEKDDICDQNTPTTPRLVIEFYDNNATSSLKTIDNIVINNSNIIEELKFSGVSKIQIPLQTTTNNTNFNFRLVSSGNIPVLLNQDSVEINYSRNNVFISRACGFKTDFTLNKTNAFLILADSNNWIKNVTINQPSISNENEIHIKLFI